MQEKRRKAQMNIARSTDRRVLRTRKAVRDAVLALSQVKDFSEVTITSVAQEANIDRKTFYLHYSSVEDVVDEIIREDADRLVLMLRDEAFRQGDEVNISSVFEHVCRILANDFRDGNLVLQCSNPEMLLLRVEPCLVRAMVEEDALGLASAAGPHLENVVTFFCAGVLSLLRRWMANDCVTPAEELAAFAGAAVASGVEGFLNKDQKFLPNR